MNYAETLQYLFTAAPMFQNVGVGAYKEGLSTTEALDKHFGHPHRDYKIIHVGGTNGKGSTSHTLAAILQSAGFKVGLYTSPHLVDFRERIRVNGKCISEQRVVDFVEKERHFFEPLQPSFFELTTALAFLYFKEEKVDIAVVEVGLGGRLDCTNIVQPMVSVVTNISYDHMNLLGNSLEAIAFEKAGIFKSGVPAIVGAAQPEVRDVFERVATEKHAHLVYAEQEDALIAVDTSDSGKLLYETKEWGSVEGELRGDCQRQNARTILTVLRYLPRELQASLSASAVREGFSRVNALTGLQGRWQILCEQPRIIADTGHNEDAWRYLTPQLLQEQQKLGGSLRIVFGACSDKDVRHILGRLPQSAVYYWTQAETARALRADLLAKQAQSLQLEGSSYVNVRASYDAAVQDATDNDVIFVGGSSFVVADLLKALTD